MGGTQPTLVSRENSKI